MFTYACPQCQMTLQAQEQWAGLQARCPRCQTITVVPQPMISTLPDARRPSAPTPRTPDESEPPGTPAAQPPKTQAPVLVPGYEILGELGRGGMGVVYKARQTALKRLVALKMILVGEHASRAEQTRFRHEAESVARLAHPNIVQIYEIGEHAGRPFFSLEFCPGGTLAQRVADALLPPRQAASIIETLARAIHAAHQVGIVHRDLKPANVLLAADGTPKITDFGLAKQLDQTQHTASGAVMGTPAYMAPEQAEGKIKDIGPWTDVYALGAILYELLTGRPPFSGPVRLVLINALITDPPAPQSINREVPRDLETICLKCLEKQPARRYASAQALADDLHRYLNNEPIQARPVGAGERLWRWARRNPGVAAMASLTALVLVAVAAASLVMAVRFDQLARDANDKAEDARLASELAGAEQRKAEQARLESQLGQVRLNAKCGWDRYPIDPTQALPWFVESLQLARGHSEQERKAQMRLGTLLGQYPPFHVWFNVRSAAFDTRGSRVVTTADDGVVRVWDVATRVAASGPLNHPAPVLTAAFSGDGERLVTGCVDGKARVWDLESGKLLHTVNGMSAVWYARFTPDGGKVLLGSGDSSFAACDLTGQPKGEDLGLVLNVSEDGQLVVRAGNPQATSRLDEVAEMAPLDAGKVEVWDLARGRPLHEAVTLPTQPMVAALSPDNKLLATAHPVSLPTRDNLQTDGSEVRVWDLTTGKTRATRTVAGQVTCLAVSSSKVAFGTDEGQVQLWALSEDARDPLFTAMMTTAAAQLTFTPGGNRLAILWSGFRMAAVPGSPLPQNPPEGARVSIIDTDTLSPLTPELKHPRDASKLRFSADGKRLLVSGGSSGEGEAWAWDLSATATFARVLPQSENVFEPLFSADGKEVYGFPLDGNARHTWDIPGGKLVAGRGTGGPVSTREATSIRMTPVMQKITISRMDDRGRMINVEQDRTVFTAVQTASKQTGDEETLRELERREKSRPMLTLPGRQFVVAFSDDSQLVLASEFSLWGQQQVSGRVWDTASKTPRSPLLPHLGRITTAAFNPDKTMLATVADSRMIRLWDLTTGDPLTAPILSPVPVSAVRLGPDPRWLVTVRESGPDEPDLLWVWDLQAAEERPSEQVALQAQLLSRRRLDPTRTLEPLEGRKYQEAWEMLQWHSPPKVEEIALRDWHRIRADECLRGGIWEPARLHLTHLIDRPEGASGDLFARRALALASQGRHEDALKDLNVAVEKGHAPAQVLRQLATAHLALGQEDDYRKVCARLLSEHGGGDDEGARMAAWTAVLRPGAVADPTGLVSLAERLARKQPKDQGLLLLLGAVYHRAGRHQEAVERLDAASKWEAGNTLLTPEQYCLSGLFQALAYHRLKAKQKAEDALRSSGATELTDGALPWGDPNAPPPPWTFAVEARALVREAEGLLGPLSEKAPAPAPPPKDDNRLPPPKGES